MYKCPPDSIHQTVCRRKKQQGLCLFEAMYCIDCHQCRGRMCYKSMLNKSCHRKCNAWNASSIPLNSTASMGLCAEDPLSWIGHTASWYWPSPGCNTMNVEHCRTTQTSSPTCACGGASPRLPSSITPMYLPKVAISISYNRKSH